MDPHDEFDKAAAQVDPHDEFDKAVAKPHGTLDAIAEGLGAVKRGFKAGAFSGFDDEMDADAAKLQGHPGKTNEEAVQEALQKARDEKRLAQKNHPWLYGAGDTVGSLASVLTLRGLAKGAGVLASPAAQSAIQGGVRQVGDSDEGRGLNLETAIRAVLGAGTSYAGAKVGETATPVVAKPANWLAQKFGDRAAEYSGRIDAAAADASQARVDAHNGALGAPQAKVNRSIEYAENNGPHVLQGLEDKVADIKAQQLQVKRRDIEDFVKQQGIGVTPEMLDQERSRIVREQIERTKGLAKTDLKEAAMSVPFVKPISKVVGAGLRFMQYMGTDTAKMNFNSALERAMSVSPEFASKYGSAIGGSAAPSVAHHILQQLDPEYRETLRRASEMDNGAE